MKIAFLAALCLVSLATTGAAEKFAKNPEGQLQIANVSILTLAEHDAAETKSSDPEPSRPRWYGFAERPEWWLVAAAILGIVAAVKTLKAIQKQADAMMDADSALFLIVWGNYIHAKPVDGGRRDYFSWTFKNVGKGPGFLKSAVARFVVIHKLADLPPIPEYPVPIANESEYDSEPITPSDQERRPFIETPVETDLSFEELRERETAGECSYYAYGIVRYTDIYGRDQESRFGVIWKHDSEQQNIGRFQIAGPYIYNRYKKEKDRWYHPLQTWTDKMKAQIEKMSVE